MRYTEAQARAKAQQIFERFGSQINLACSNSIVGEDFLGGFIGVEAGIDRNGQIRPESKRFEPHVAARLRAVRDGLISSYNNIRRSDIAGLTDAAIQNLATSWGVTQIMGWHLIHNLTGTIAELRDPDKHLQYAVQLLVLTAAPHFKTRNFGNVLRIWNSGSANGKTYDPSYVDNALAVKTEYQRLLNASSRSFENSAVVAPADVPPEPTRNGPADMQMSATPDPLDQAQPPTSQVAENIVNVGAENAVPDNFVPEDKPVDAPPPTGFLAKLQTQGAALLAFIGGGAGLKEFFGVQISPETVGLLKILLPTVLGLGFLGFLVWFIAEKMVGFKTLKLEADIATDPKRHNLVINRS